MVARVVPVAPFDLVVFGATGDLARRKLLPALYHRLHDGQMPIEARVIGAARAQMDAEGFRRLAAEALDEFVAPADLDPDSRRRFLATLDYVPLDVTKDDDWQALADTLGAPDPERPRAFYLSVAPRFFGVIAERIAAAGLAGAHGRIVVEKPFGHDLPSARALNQSLARHFDEGRIYRIDHYLGKETVQNLMALRFANALFEPLWNAHHVDHVQITVAETVGVGGRGPYYDGVGAMRDMVQNHLLQLLCLTAMEPPARLRPDDVRDEKLKVLRALAPVDAARDVVRGQYGAGPGVASYADDVGDADTRTESFVALRAHVENWRWSGVPFYLRTGKRLRARMSEIAVAFKDPPHSIFAGAGGRAGANVLAIRLQPDEGITLSMTVKDPGPGGMRLTPAELDMTFAEQLGGGGLRMPDAYERLVMDVIRGDQTLFMRGDEVEAAWRWVDPIIAAWEERGERPALYDPGSSGPEDALMLMHRDGRRWREISA
ncbi:glucose-6-phosphate dehydrogenase [Oceanicella actignis]|uniref:Glucose-6-phosphate 1-dehydrogenase n=1 Tax=Oceanicella actignis TaxID=1189325 RepID=A0A1M7TCL5_9RHOB|nr:glucose-6-phosphate dehydrogenase [Oceanicella actignis]TYO89255.1 glucose-6-phosphate 1-dehydrogenase [Oceanicella actignis]SET55352.1 glucose-6-phosphate 1-dehydrogenase [Oceanicella actignis]SHN68421.1 glucose-6-phosphate 1-dehydrogenase [Oceanicella actignis]